MIIGIAVAVVAGFLAGSAVTLTLTHKLPTSEALRLRRELADLKDALRTAYLFNGRRSMAEREIADAARGYVSTGRTKAEYAKAASDGT